jgi:hypothetical protein
VNELTRTALVIITFLALTGTLTMLRATRFGIGVSPDSTVYIDAARNLTSGRGLLVFSSDGTVVPLTHYPPLYSSLLALLATAGISLESAARWLNAILFGANIFLVGIAIERWVGGLFWPPLLGAFLTLSAPDLLSIHSFALTEPLYLSLTLVGLLWLGTYLERQRRGFLIAASLAIALSLLTRYVAAATVLAGALALLASNRRASAVGVPTSSEASRNSTRRLIDTMIFVSIASAPLAVWAIRNHFVAAHAVDRQVVFHPVKFQQLVAGASTVSQWLLIGKVRGDVRIIAFLIEILVIIALALYLTAKGESSERKSSEQPQLLLLFIITYVTFLLLTASFVDADTVLDHRSLLPIHVAAMLLVITAAARLYSSERRPRSIRVVLIVIALSFAGSYCLRGFRWLSHAQADGQGYASRAWKNSPAIEQTKRLPPEIPVYSNGYDAIYYLTGRRAILIPEKIIHGTGQPNQHYESEVERMTNDIREHNGAIVYFHTLPERIYLPTEDELRSRLLLQFVPLRDGSILQANMYERAR